MMREEISPVSQSKGVVYCISCKQCISNYIGETGRTFEIRLKEHEYTFKTGNLKLQIGCPCPSYRSYPGYQSTLFCCILASFCNASDMSIFVSCLNYIFHNNSFFFFLEEEEEAPKRLYKYISIVFNVFLKCIYIVRL